MKPLMEDTKGRRTKIKNAPIAVTPEGIWCCRSPVLLQSTVKDDNLEPLKKSKPRKEASSIRRPSASMRPSFSTIEEADCFDVGQRQGRPKVGSLPRKVSIEYGEPGTSDMKVVLLGKQGFCVKLCVHKNILIEKCGFFADKLSGNSSLSCLEIDDCEDVELYVEIVGLMYCKEFKQRLIKQSVFRILRILKVAELLGFISCIQACLKHLEAVPWVGEEEEKLVISSVLRLKSEEDEVKPVLRRIYSSSVDLRRDTFAQILELLLTSKEEKARNEMKTVVLKLLKESSSDGSVGFCKESIYAASIACLPSLAGLFRRAAEVGSCEKAANDGESVARQIALECDNMAWLVDILIDWRAAEEFCAVWASHQEIATWHSRVSVVSRYHVSAVTAKLFVAIGNGGLFTAKETRHMLLQTWLQPLIGDFCWLQNGCRSFDRGVVEEGIGRTILTLPLDTQQSIFLAWLGSYLKGGDKCPNLHKSFEVWWKRAFTRPHLETLLS